MAYQLVYIPMMALVPGSGGGGGQPPGQVSPPIYYPPEIWPTPPPSGGGAPPPQVSPPIYYPPTAGQGPGFPTHPIAPGGPPPYPDQGLPGPQPTPTPPIYYPPEIWPQPPGGGGGGGQPPGIWGGGNVPMPSPPIYLPPEGGGQPPTIWPSPGVPSHPIYYPPGIWGGGNVPMPSPPIHLPPPPVAVIDPGNIPQHPELPDLNIGVWATADVGGPVYFPCFITWPVPDQMPVDYQPKYPEQGVPGTWKAVVYQNYPRWAWFPSAPAESPPSVEHHQAEKK